MKRFLVALIAFFILANAGFGVYLEPLLYTLTPLQRYYLRPYLLSSMKGGDASAETKVRWLWKVRPEGGAEPKQRGKKALSFQYGFATEEDVVPVPAGQLLWKSDRIPFSMSPKALLEGWSGVVWRNPVEVNSRQLRDDLRQEFFDGEPVWRFFVQPISVLVLGLLLLWLVARERAAYYRRHPWAAVPYWRHLGRQSLEAGGQFRRRLEIRRTPLALPPAKPLQVIEAVPIKARTVMVASVPQSCPETVPVSPSKPPVQPALWDASKGLE